MPKSVKDRNRDVRRAALREQLAEQCRVQHVLDNVKKMETEGAAMEAQELNALKAATETRLKLINKYLPDVKSIELTGEDGESIKVDNTWTIKVAK